MPRHLIVMRGDERHELRETPVPEKSLQGHLHRNHHLLPLSDLGITDEMCVSAREVPVAGGKMDVLAVTVAGDVIIAEVKIGPKNSDFRRVLAQLIDYGAGLRGMSVADLRQRLVGNDPRQGKRFDCHLAGDAPEAVQARETLERTLRVGAFHYIVVAQQFTSTMDSALSYLNDVTTGPSFHAVELIQFSPSDPAASSAAAPAVVEGRMVMTPSTPTAAKSDKLSGAAEFLDTIPEQHYRDTLGHLLDGVAGVGGSKVYWGTKGCSVKAAIPGRSPLSVAWIYPPGVSGFAGARDLTLGWWEDPSSKLDLPAQSLDALQAYRAAIDELGGDEPISTSLLGRVLSPVLVVEKAAQIQVLLETVIDQLSSVVPDSPAAPALSPEA